MSQAPAHAGSLRPPERLAFVGMFIAMAAFVVGLSVIAAKSGVRVIDRPLTAGSRTEPIGQGGQRHVPTPHVRGFNARLSAALRATLGNNSADLSVGVIDTTTGAKALYHASQHYHAASVVRADILAALLYQHQLAGTLVSDQDAGLAGEMIDNGSGTAATRLWRAIGRAAGLAAANRALRLRHTIPGPADAWGLTRTTVADQLQLLSDLATARSALDPASRRYELGLIASMAATQGWGVPPAGSPGSRSYAVNEEWRPDPRRFAVNSFAIIHRGGHALLVVVLSPEWPTEAAGLSAVRAAAMAAVSVIAKHVDGS